MNKNDNTIKGYVFVGNTETKGNLSQLTNITYIIGDLAYDIHGNEIEPHYMRPLFVAQEDYNNYNKIMQTELERIRNG